MTVGLFLSWYLTVGMVMCIFNILRKWNDLETIRARQDVEKHIPPRILWLIIFAALVILWPMQFLGWKDEK